MKLPKVSKRVIKIGIKTLLALWSGLAIYTIVFLMAMPMLNGEDINWANNLAYLSLDIVNIIFMALQLKMHQPIVKK